MSIKLEESLHKEEAAMYAEGELLSDLTGQR